MEITVYYTVVLSNTGTITGATWQDESMCVSGRCLLFDGDSANVATTGEISALTNNFTFSSWIKWNGTDAENQTIFFNGDRETDGWNVRLDNSDSDQLSIVCENNDTVTSNTSLTQSKWHHLTVQRDSGTWKLYLDGVAQSLSGGTTCAPSTSTLQTVIGHADTAGTTQGFHGFMDEVKYYPYVRSEDQVKSDYNARGSVNGASVQLGPDNAWMSDNLIGYWKMEDNVSGNGQTITDHSGANNDGTTQDGGATLDCTVAGKFGRGCDFEGDGGDDSITMGDITVGDNYTLSAWINGDDFSADEATIISKWDNDNDRWTFMVATNGALAFIKNERAGAEATGCSNTSCGKQTAASAISTGTWHHVAATIALEGTSVVKIRLFIDGQEVAPSGDDDPFIFTPDGGDDPLLIARRQDNNDEFNGTIDDVRIYNRTLSSAEVRKLYNFAPGPIGYWPLDENTGTSITYDHSGNGFNGTMNGSMTESDWVRGKFGSALDFDSSNDYIAIADSDLLDMVDSWTISGWVYDNNSDLNHDWDHIIAKGNVFGGGNMPYNVAIGYNQIKYSVEVGGTPTGVQSFINSYVSSKEWFHFAIVVDDENDVANVYINGELVDSDSFVVNAVANSSEVTIGSEFGSEYWNGYLDEIRLYNYARTSGQIIEDLNGGHPIGGSPIGSQGGYWAFDEMYGDSANDTSSYGVVGDLGDSDTTCPAAGVDCPTWTANGKVNSALDFDGDDVIELDDYPYTYDHLNATERFSITAWIKSDTSGTDDGFIFGISSAGQIQYALYIGSGVLELVENNSTIATGTTNLNSSGATWYHVAATWDKDVNGGEAIVYVNGIPEGSGTQASSLTDYFQTIRIGLTAGGFTGFDGLIDEVKFYTSALTPEEVLIDMNSNAAADFGSKTQETNDIVDGAPNDPVLYLDFNENTGTSTVSDKSGFGNSMTMNGTMTESDWVQGPRGFGSALDLDGSDDYLSQASNTQNNISGATSVSVWVKFNTNEDFYIVSKAQDGTNKSYELSTNTGSSGPTVEFRTAATGTCLTWVSSGDTSELTLGEWYHVTGVYIPSTAIRIYLNGRLENENTTSIPATQCTNSSALEVGDQATFDGNLEGQIDEVKIFNAALTSAQVAYDYNRGLPVSWWQFDECQGSTAYDGTGGGSDGTINIAGGNEFTSLGTCESGTSTEMWNTGGNGKYNASVALDGGDEYVAIADNDKFSFGNNSSDRPFSVTGWVKYDQAENGLATVISKYNATGVELEYRMEISSSDHVSFDLVDDSTLGNIGRSASSFTLPNNQWFFVAMTYDGSGASSGMDIYIDGVIRDDANTDAGGYTAMENTTAPIWIGAQSIGGTIARELDGSIDDLRIYNYNLSSNQILNIMNYGSAAYFGPNEGSP
ncbi:LamG domain-containing protein [candidate division WWE3 bacterium]|uniref:LamG domain-containing protein n=1 Tax=candidate division WWE3 bacterium TaxID=2053526 RepID=A0A955RPI9_UNCKA|nr:LamG domain-containing protein [candidate division WWE3 bacterium]